MKSLEKYLAQELLKSKSSDDELLAAISDFEYLKGALTDLFNSGCGKRKSCGHEFNCICATDKTKKVLGYE
jgi:hypothetical protein